MKHWTKIEGALAGEEIAALREVVNRTPGLSTETFGRSGLGPRYRVIDGEQIGLHLPEIGDFGERRVRALAERFAGRPLELMSSPKRAMRVQVYDRKDHAFRWHLDGHAYAALLTLENTNGGRLEVLPPVLSQTLRCLMLPRYVFPQVFSLFPFEAITAKAGDLILMRGARSFHRGVTVEEDGRRVLVAYMYDEVGRKRYPLLSRIEERIARFVNY